MRRSASTPSNLSKKPDLKDNTHWRRSLKGKNILGLQKDKKRSDVRIIIAAEFLPASISRSTAGKWLVRWDDESTLFYLAHASLTNKAQYYFVGQLREFIAPEHEIVVERILHQYRCIPVFVPKETADKHRRYCDTVFRPLFGNFIDVFAERPTGWWNRGEFSDNWHQYKMLNRIFGHKLRQFCDNSAIWIHGYELLCVPTFINMHAIESKTPTAFFLPTPFPSSEVFRTLSTCKTVLWGLLNVDQICFPVYEYTRHFVACCSRILNLTNAQVKKGYIQLKIPGRAINLLSLHPGIEPVVLQRYLKDFTKQASLCKDKIIILGIDNAKAHSGLALKMLAFSHFLTNNPDLRQRVVLKQYLVGKLSITDSLLGREWQAIQEAADRLNAKHMGVDGSLAVEYKIIPEMDLATRIKAYTEATILLATPIREGFNPIPLEFAVTSRFCNMHGTLIVSEFSSCNCVLTSAKSVNPYDPIGTACVIEEALALPAEERLEASSANYEAVKRTTTYRWTQSVLKKLMKSHDKANRPKLVRFGYGDTSHVTTTEANTLDKEQLAHAWLHSKNRVLCFDFRGTLVDYSAEDASRRYFVYGHHRVPLPSAKLLEDLEKLSNLPNTTVAIVSGLSKEPMIQAFESIKNLWLFADTGYYMRRGGSDRWETTSPSHLNTKMYALACPAMEFYCRRTIGSYILKKECTIVLEYHDADMEFGKLQAKNLESTLREALEKEPQLDVFSGTGYVAARPVCFSKASSLKLIIDRMRETGCSPDFCLCMGDDTSDELMFSALNEDIQIKEKFGCKVGMKPTCAEYSVQSAQDVRDILHRLQSVAPLSHSKRTNWLKERGSVPSVGLAPSFESIASFDDFVEDEEFRPADNIADSIVGLSSSFDDMDDDNTKIEGFYI